MDRPVRGHGEFSLIRPPREWPRQTLRGGLILVAALALAAVWREAALTRAAILTTADQRTALQVAAYLREVAPPGRAIGTGADARLLSATGTLVGASFWEGHAQVWLDETPLLPGDTTGAAAAVAPLQDLDGAVRGAVAVWGSVPKAAEAAMVGVSGAVALAATLAAWLVGSAARRRRPRRILLGLSLAVVAGGIGGQAAAVIRSERAATDAGLFRTRRILEVSALGARLSRAAAAGLAPGLALSAVEAAGSARDSAVVRDSSGTWLVAVASSDQAWRVTDRSLEATANDGLLRIAGFGLLALVLVVVAAALPPGAGYLMESRPDPRAPA